jgi:hypothetical protein
MAETYSSWQERWCSCAKVTFRLEWLILQNRGSAYIIVFNDFRSLTMSGWAHDHKSHEPSYIHGDTKVMSVWLCPSQKRRYFQLGAKLGKAKQRTACHPISPVDQELATPTAKRDAHARRPVQLWTSMDHSYVSSRSRVYSIVCLIFLGKVHELGLYSKSKRGKASWLASSSLPTTNALVRWIS